MEGYLKCRIWTETVAIQLVYWTEQKRSSWIVSKLSRICETVLFHGEEEAGSACERPFGEFEMRVV